MKKFLFISLAFFSFAVAANAQSSEGEVFNITQRVKIFLPVSDPVAQLEGTERFICIGLLGNQNDIKALVGYMDRFIVNDKDMTTRVDASISEEMIDYYKFYLDPLYDANDFQKMLEMLGVKKFNVGTSEKEVNSFSNTIYASIKSKNSK